MILNLHNLVKKYNMSVMGIIHVGAHKAEELDSYKAIGVNNVVWIEANTDLIPIIKKRVGNQIVINAIVSDSVKEVDYHKHTLTGSNSILKSNLNLKWRSDLKIVGTERRKTMPLYTIQSNENMLVMDTQGAELMILKGANLSQIDYIYTEVHKQATYIDCPMVKDIDNYLLGYKRVETEWFKDRYGDALYIRKELL